MVYSTPVTASTGPYSRRYRTLSSASGNAMSSPNSDREHGELDVLAAAAARISSVWSWTHGQ